MKIEFDLTDKDGETLVTLKGNKYIPKIGTKVFFSDEVIDDNGNNYYIDEYGICESYFYEIHKDKLTIICKINYELNEHTQKMICNYNTTKWKK